MNIVVLVTGLVVVVGTLALIALIAYVLWKDLQ